MKDRVEHKIRLLEYTYLFPSDLFLTLKAERSINLRFSDA